MPPACAGCGRVGSLLCPTCRTRLVAPFNPQDRFVAPDAGIVVGDALTLAMAAFAYEGPMRRALAALKYTGAARLAPILANEAAPRLTALLPMIGRATLVPVPLHRERLRSRGYNQAQLLAKSLAKTASLPMRPVLERTRQTTKQHRLNRSARLHNLRGAFEAVGSVPAAVILVDDIITTTATLEACASVLREAGAQSIYGFAIAREV